MNTIEIENIDQMRRQEGIEDVELRKEIRGLAIGDLVKLTLHTAANPAGKETLPVRITQVSGRNFQGELAAKPTVAGLTKLRVGAALSFSATHIHSVAKKAVVP